MYVCKETERRYKVLRGERSQERGVRRGESGEGSQERGARIGESGEGSQKLCICGAVRLVWYGVNGAGRTFTTRRVGVSVHVNFCFVN